MIILNKTYSIWILKPWVAVRVMQPAKDPSWWPLVSCALLSLFLNMLVVTQVQAGQYRVRIVLDGDTILLRSGERVRYLGIDAPEMDTGEGKAEYLAQASKDFNRRLVEGGAVRLTYDQERRDGYGRLLAYVFLQDGRMVNALMVREGLAMVMPKRPNTRYQDFLLSCQRKAIRKGMGLWQHLPDSEDAVFVGNSRSFRFHKRDCASLAKVPKGRQVHFRSRYEAFWAGYSPCKRCRPTDRTHSEE